MVQFLQAETVVIMLLLVASLVAIAVRRRWVPYAVALVVAGLLVTLRSLGARARGDRRVGAE